MHRAHAAYERPQSNDADLINRFATTLDRLARRCASRTGGAVQADDLWSAGALGLLDAAGRFDAAKGVRFETFVEHRIRGAMVDELRRLDHLPRRLRAKTDEAATARKVLESELGRPVSTDEVATKLGVSAEEVDGLEGLSQPPLPLLELHAELTGAPASQHEAFERKQQSGLIAAAIAALPERQRTVLGLVYVEGLTYREVAQVLEVSEPRVCQIHGEAIKALRAKLNPFDSIDSAGDSI